MYKKMILKIANTLRHSWHCHVVIVDWSCLTVILFESAHSCYLFILQVTRRRMSFVWAHSCWQTSSAYVWEVPAKRWTAEAGRSQWSRCRANVGRQIYLPAIGRHKWNGCHHRRGEPAPRSLLGEETERGRQPPLVLNSLRLPPSAYRLFEW